MYRIKDLSDKLAQHEGLLERLKMNRNAFENVPEGKLRVSRSNNCFQYYFRENGTDRYKYVHANDISLVKLIAQREYEEEMIRALEKDVRNLGIVLDYYDSPGIVENLYEKLSDGRKAVVEPITVTDEMFLKRWYEEHPGNMNNYSKSGGIKTERGDIVRSKSEMILADRFYKRNIPYQYEPEIFLKDGNRLCPDFAVLNLRERRTYYWEHFGMIADGSYAVSSMDKILKYEENGMFPGDILLITEESVDNPLNMDIVDGLIRRYLL